MEGWMNGDLQVDDIERYLRLAARMEEDEYDDETVRHIANVCHGIYMRLRHGRDGGHFVEHMVHNNLLGAIGRADDKVQRCLKFIVRFLYNATPMFVYSAIRSNDNTDELLDGEWDDGEDD